jgi:HAD superfamily hydrolase (TIGR01490 family)
MIIAPTLLATPTNTAPLTLALFDLDHTLLPIDSDHAWGVFLVNQGVVDATEHAEKNHYFYAQYQAGQLDIQEFLTFQLGVLARFPRRQLEQWRADFMAEVIQPAIHTAALELVQSHQAQGHLCAIVTATNTFVTRPIADLFGIEHLIGTIPATDTTGEFTGQVEGTPSFREGKITRVHQWLDSLGYAWADCSASWFYSDSRNDIPLLEQVTHPIATNPDTVLTQTATAQGWIIRHLFTTT